MKKLMCILIVFLLEGISYAVTSKGDNLSVSSESKFHNAKEKNSYSENVHMYICIEALKLLRDKFPALDFTLFENHMGTMIDCHDRPWGTGKITTGACREDCEDVVFGITGPGMIHRSSSHFWNADNRINGDHSLTTLNVAGNNVDFPNSYTKISRYISGQWNYWNGSGYAQRLFIRYTQYDGNTYLYSYHTRGLINFFKTKKIWYEGYYNILGQFIPKRYEVTLNNVIFDRIVWELLGRMSHLLQDITVPAHTHNDVHVFLDGGDCYHDYIDDGGYANFNWTTAKNQGGFINPYETEDDPVRYLMYTADQLADHYPSGPDCLEIPQQHLGNNNLFGGTNAMLEQYYQELGPTPPNITNLYSQGNYCFNHAIRATAGLFYWFAVETGIIPTDPNALPKISSFYKNLPDNFLYREDRLKIICNATGSNLHYDWFIKACDSNNTCTLPIPGITINEYQNEINLYNLGFLNKWSCTRYDSLCNASSFNKTREDHPLEFFVGLKVWNHFGQSTKFFKFPYAEKFYPLQSIRTGNPPPSGCPYIYSFNGELYNFENNILYTSQFQGNENKDVTDKLILKEEPHFNEEDSTFSFAIKETDNDTDFFNKIELLQVDHPENTSIAVTKNNDIVIYFDNSVVSPSFAQKSGIDITKELEYDTAYSNNIKGEGKETINIFFNDIRKIKKNDSTALLIDPSLPDNPVVPIVKDVTGTINYHYTDGVVKSEPIDFGRRIVRSMMTIPSRINKQVASIDIMLKESCNLSFAALASVGYSGFIVRTLDIIRAENNVEGNIINLITTDDDKYAVIDSSSCIMLRFKDNNIIKANNMQRSYVFVVKGKIHTPANRRFISTELNEGNETAISKLNPNFPNPFNPQTKISYTLSKEANVKIIVYNVLGKEISILSDEKHTSGNHYVTFDGSNFASGIYYYKLVVDNVTLDVRKMLLVK